MFTQKDVLRIFKEAYDEFSKKHKIHCSLKLVRDEDFFYLSKKSKIVKNQLSDGVPVLVGALVRHTRFKEIVYLCPDVINQLTDDEYFVKSLIMHEFYHILLKKEVKSLSLSEEIESELRVREEMAREFPLLAKNIV